MDPSSYPRVLAGYGETPPDPQWPGGAKLALQFVVNYEEGGENCLLHGDAASEAFLSEIVGAEPWPGQRNWNMETLYEYGARAGFWRLHRLFTQAGIPVTVFGVTTALERGPAQLAAMRRAGWEIASHGLKWIEYKDYPLEKERADMEAAIRLHREVTGERIRDKIAASKARGMWMGGLPPLGYDPPTDGSRTLKVNEDEAERVRHIFARYLELGSVHSLQRDLEARRIYSKFHITAKGRRMGGLPFSRGALFHLLRNRVYLGQITHKGEVYDGEHQAIVDAQDYEQVQVKLDAQVRRHRNRTSTRKIKAPRTGKLFDAAGEPMSPTTSRGKSGGSYRYYVSASLQQGASPASDSTAQNMSPSSAGPSVPAGSNHW